MTDAIFALPKPEVRGVGEVMYRCKDCGELMPPEQAVIVADFSYHLEHSPEDSPDGF